MGGGPPRGNGGGGGKGECYLCHQGNDFVLLTPKIPYTLLNNLIGTDDHWAKGTVWRVL